MGWVSIHRKIEDSFLWADKPFARGQAWIDLIMLVNHKDNEIFYDGKPVLVKRGEHITSETKLANRWGWSRKKVDTFLRMLESKKMINLEISTRKGTKINIVNYSLYQNTEPVEAQMKNNPRANEEQMKNINNNENNKNNERISVFDDMSYMKKNPIIPD